MTALDARSLKGRPAKKRAKWEMKMNFVSLQDRRPFTPDKYPSYYETVRWDRVAYILITIGTIILWVNLK